MANKKKKYNARFPPARIKKIMQKDEEVGKVAAPVPVIISRALELFVESLVRRASEVTRSRNAKTLTTTHLKASILADERMEFLRELVSTVPDVHGDEENLEGVLPIARPKLIGVRKRSKNGNDAAGPSHSTAEETDSAEDEEDDYLEEETDEGSSENTTDALPAVDYKNSASVAYAYHPQFPPSVQSLQQQFVPTVTNIARPDDDYDS